MQNGKAPQANSVVHALTPRATESGRLSQVAPPYRDVAHWLIDHELGEVAAGQMALAAAVEQICQKFFARLARVTSFAACQAFLSRALHIPRAEFPFLGGVRAGATGQLLVDGLETSIAGVDVAFARAGLEAVVALLVDLLGSFIGRELTMGMLRDVWPELPVAAPAESIRVGGAETKAAATEWTSASR
jgi:hypothetical protein